MRPATLALLAVSGSRTDLLRTALTALSAGLAAIALLAAATVGSIRGYADRYTNALLVESGLRPGVMLALAVVALPVLALAGQCIRLGVPARDRRLAAIRLAGATPAEAVLIATAETAVASLVGSVGGLVAYLVGRHLIVRHDAVGRLRLPTDVLPPAAVIVPLLLAVPLLAAVVGALLMRRVIVTPLGVARRIREHRPRPWPGLLITGGLALFGATLNPPERVHLSEIHRYELLGAAVLAVIAGVVLGTGWISHTAGRLLRRYGRAPSMLLAGQRLVADPWNGSRTLAALLASVVAGAAALGFQAMLETEVRAYALENPTANDGTSGLGAAPDFYYNGIRLFMIVVGLCTVVAAAGMLVALAESIVGRRRAYASLTATGVPRRTLSAAVLWQALTPLVPALLLALGAGVSLTRLAGSDIEMENGFLHVPVPVAQLALLGAGALLAVLLAAGAGLVVLRSSTDLEELRI